MPILIKYHPAFFYSPAGIVRFLKLKLLGRQIIVRGRCQACGACCQKMSLDIDGSWIRSARGFRKLVQTNPDYGRFEITGRDRQGYLEFRCSWLQPDGTCRDYENRLKICREYPDIELYYANGVLTPGCGYIFEEVPDFEKLLNRQMRKSAGGERSCLEDH